MDLVHQNSSSASGLGICSSLGVLSGDSRMASSYPGSGGGGSGGPLSPNLSSMKQCRSTSDVEVEPRDDGGPLKLARKDSFSYRPGSGDKQALNNGGAGAGAGAAGNNNNNNNNGLAGSNSFSGDNGASRIACSPTNSCLSDGVLVATDAAAAAAAAANLMGDTRMLRSDPMAGAQAGASGYNLAGSNMRPFSYQSYQYAGAAGAGSPLMLAAATARGDHHLGMQGAMGMRGPFTANQWAELEHQALIFKYMMAGASVPPELLNPIRRSVALNNLASSHPSLRMGWGNFHLGIPNNPDPEPGRCRRTDGKKWRCSREVVPDQKYCDRHMHRGRNRSKKNAENQAAAAAAAAAASSQSAAAAAAAAAGAPPPPGSSVGVVQNPGLGHQMHHSGMRPPLGMNGQQQNHQHAAAAGSGSPFASSDKSGSGFSQLPTGIPSGNNNSSPSSLQFPMQSLSGASPGGNKDYRYMNGMSRAELGLGAEQMLFSDSSSWQQQHHHHHQQQQQHQSFGKFPRLGNGSNTGSSTSSNSPLYQPHHQQQQQLRSLSGAFGMSEVNHHPLLSTSTSTAGYGAAADPRDSCEEQPLRHFFDDWPRQHHSNRDPTALSWNDIDDESHKARAAASTPTSTATTTTSTSHANTPTTTSPPLLPPPGPTPNSGSASSATHLSISLPMSSPDFRLQGDSPRGKLSLSPLKLSMSRSEFDEDQLGGGAGDPGTRMGLGVGLGISHQHKQWVHHQSAALEGGPLAEVLQSSSTPRDKASPPGLNLLGDASWESSSRETSRMASPTAVLKTPFGTFSDSSSNASSPRAVVQADASLLPKQQQLTS